MSSFSAAQAADFLAAQFKARTSAAPTVAGPTDRVGTYRVHDLLIAALGRPCGWKVGRSKTETEPYCAPLPASRRLDDGATYRAPGGVARLEAELGLRLGRDVPASSGPLDRETCLGLIDAIVPSIEIIETRLAAPAAQDPEWKLADLQGNGGVVFGPALPWQGQALDPVPLVLGFAGEQRSSTAAHPFGDPLGLFCWTLNTVTARGIPMRKGEVVINGSFCGIADVPAGTRFVVTFPQHGEVSLNVV
jgi:2-keto-4-pentenoate hydratase